MADPQVLAVFSVAGFSFSGAAPNQGLMFARLRPYEERREASQSLTAVIARLQGQLFGGITGGLVIPMAPPSLQGVSQFGGFQMQVVDNSGGPIERLAQVTGDMIGRGIQSGRVAGLYSSFTADDPQLVVDIDRDRARGLNLPMSAVTDTLQVLLGSQYVNDFDFNNRAYRVYVQADQAFRSRPDNLRQFYARTTTGNMVPLDTVVRFARDHGAVGHQPLQPAAVGRNHGFAGPGRQLGQGIQLMDQIAAEALPPGFDHAWAGLSLEEIRAGSQAVLIFALSVVVVYLILAAQYESWVLPLIILLGVPLAVFGALSAQLLRGFQNDVFCQIGLVMLVGLAAKNSILIVEFAEHLRQQGSSIVDAAVESARIRLRPILMTSLAFILGVLPLAIATGAGSGARRSVGTTVMAG
jgi:HAE1 family hydrophobic/amphiphilic exporter-1